VIALQSTLRLDLPVAQSRVSAIGYHASGDGALALDPVGRQVNQGSSAGRRGSIFGGGGTGVRYYALVEGGRARPPRRSTSGAPPGPTSTPRRRDRSSDHALRARRQDTTGARIDVQPSGSPSFVVSLTHLRPDPSLTVGSTVARERPRSSARSVDVAKVEHQALSRVHPDAGNHVAIEVHPAATLASP
jgi:hypothetical protein